MKWFTLLLLLGSGAASAACPDYFNVEMRELNNTQRHNLCQLTEGKVVLVVNTASKCGLTPQYEALEKLYRVFKEEGLVVIGFPANNFMGQEPGTNAEILEFCTGKYDVTFPIAAKISVKGEDVHPLYKHLAALPAPLGGEPSWNFTKFLVDRSGNVVARFEPRTKPDDEQVVEAIRGALAPQG